DTLGLPEVEYSAFMDYQSMKDKHDYLTQFNISTPEETALTLATFGGFVEGLQLFASFAMMMNFPRFNKLKGMGQVISWSIRDESLHCEGIIRLYHEFCKEHWGGNPPAKLREQIRETCRSIIDLEDAFIDQAFGLGEIQGMASKDIKAYIRFI